MDAVSHSLACEAEQLGDLPGGEPLVLVVGAVDDLLVLTRWLRSPSRSLLGATWLSSLTPMPPPRSAYLSSTPKSRLER